MENENKKVKLTCTFDEMRVIIRALHHYKGDLEDKAKSIPENWYKENDEFQLDSIISRLVWENADWIK